MIDLPPDTAVIAGLFLMLLSVPSLLSALADSRRPALAVLLVAGGGALVWWGIARIPSGVSPGDLPDMLFSVIARLIN